MFSATLLTALVFAPGQLLDLPVANSSAMRLHVGKHGRWTMTFEETFRTRSGGNVTATKQFLEESGKEMPEELSRGLISAEFTSEVKVVGENPAKIVLTVTG